jgi:drug/metabolite transporter (DMT)-like permease
VLRRYAPVTIYAVILPIGALGLVPFVRFAPKDAAAWLLLVGLALVSTYLAYLLYYTGLRSVEASRAVLVATVEPVVAAALAAAVYGERLGPLGRWGRGLILLAAAAAAAPGPGAKASVSPRVARERLDRHRHGATLTSYSAALHIDASRPATHDHHDQTRPRARRR